MKKSQVLFIILPALLICSYMYAGAATQEELFSAMSRHLSCFPLQLVDTSEQEISIRNEKLCLASIYTATGLNPLWVTEKGPGEKAAIILHFLANAETEGLRVSDYNVAEIKSLWNAGEPDHLAQLDTQLTLSFIKYAHDVSHGRILPFEAAPSLFAEAGDSHFRPVLIIKQALAAPDLARYIAELPPSHKQYRILREALQLYRDISKSGGWDKVVDGRTLHPEDRDERVRQVRRRLAKTGDYEGRPENEFFYDDQLVQAIKKFQRKFSLEVDGIIGKKTLSALNTTAEETVNTIIVNMARWRWQEKELGKRYIMVNIANYSLKAVEDDREVLEMAVIVGKFQHQTPVFSHRVQYVDFNPFWNIPPSIARNEELPELRKDRYYLVNRKVRLFSGWQDDAVELDSTAIDWTTVLPDEMNRYKLRQDPGPWNALGQVKLVFPNEYNVYIHGTPQQELFEHNARSFSHGCIRASQPLELALFALAEESEGWSMEKINEIVAQGERKVINISSPLPVHITYQTAWIDKSGTINYSYDVYGRDRKLAEILFASKDKTADPVNNISLKE